MERAVEIFAAIQLAIIGVSHIVARHAWVEFFIWLRGRGLAGALANGFTSLAFGSIVVAFHPVWSGVPLVLTVLGVLNCVKAVQCFVFPALSLRSMQRVSVEREHEFAIAGVIALVLSAVIGYGAVVGS